MQHQSSIALIAVGSNSAAAFPLIDKLLKDVVQPVRLFYAFLNTDDWIRPLKIISAEDFEAAIDIAKAEMTALQTRAAEVDFDVAKSCIAVSSSAGQSACILRFTEPDGEKAAQITIKFAPHVRAASSRPARA